MASFSLQKSYQTNREAVSAKLSLLRHVVKITTPGYIYLNPYASVAPPLLLLCFWGSRGVAPLQKLVTLAFSIKIVFLYSVPQKQVTGDLWTRTARNIKLFSQTHIGTLTNEETAEAHYDDAIPLTLLKSKQQKITKQLMIIEHEIKAHEYTFDTISQRLKDALDMVEDCGKMYRYANDSEKRMINQAIFSKIWVKKDGHVTVDFAKPFDTLMESFTDVITRLNKEKTRSTEVPADFFSVITNRLSNFLVIV